MRKVLCVILLLMMLSGCRSYHKLDFIVVNYGIDYLDSIHHAGRPLLLQYPAIRDYTQRTILGRF